MHTNTLTGQKGRSRREWLAGMSGQTNELESEEFDCPPPTEDNPTLLLDELDEKVDPVPNEPPPLPLIRSHERMCKRQKIILNVLLFLGTTGLILLSGIVAIVAIVYAIASIIYK